MAPSTSTLLRYHQHHLSPEVFHPLQLKCSIHQILTPHFLLPQLLETTILLSVSINLTTLGGSYEWNRIVFVLLWLAHLSMKPSSCSIRQNFLPFWGWIIFHCVHIPRFICSLIGHVGCSYISAIVNNTAMNIGARTPFWSLFPLLSHMYADVRLLNRMIILCFIFWEAAILFSTKAASFYIPTSCAQGFQLLCIVSNLHPLLFLWW